MKLKDLKQMSSDERESAISKLGKDALKAANGQLGPLQAKLRELEDRYEMSTRTMVKEFRAGRLPDTADYSRWLVLARGLGGE